MSIKKVGNWKGSKSLIRSLGREMNRARDLSLKAWGLKAERIAKSHISSQDLNWAPLKPRYLRDKILQNYSPNIYVRTSDYFQAITSWVDKFKHIAYAGVKKDATNQEGQNLGNIGQRMEYGVISENLPARPLWKPTFQETMEWYLESDMRPDAILFRNLKKKKL